MVVRLDLGQDVRRLVPVGILAIGAGVKARHLGALDDRGIVGIGDDGPGRVRRVRFADHAEQRFVARLAVEDPGGVEDLVSTVLGIGLREHRQLDIGRISPGGEEELEQVIEFVVGQREAEPRVGFNEGVPAAGQEVDEGERLRRDVAKEVAGLREVVENGFQHAIMEQGGDAFPGRRQDLAAAAVDAVGDAALDPLDHLQAAVVGDVGRFRRPRRDGPDAWRDEEEIAACLAVDRSFFEQERELSPLAFGERLSKGDEVPVFGGADAHPRQTIRQALLQTLQAERRKGGGAAEEEEVGHGGLQRR
jgi:hypothetical protein